MLQFCKLIYSLHKIHFNNNCYKYYLAPNETEMKLAKQKLYNYKI